MKMTTKVQYLKEAIAAYREQANYIQNKISNLTKEMQLACEHQFAVFDSHTPNFSGRDDITRSFTCVHCGYNKVQYFYGD